MKLAVAVVLAGGSSHSLNDEINDIQTRAESHLLLIGDPGTGKSEMLRFAAKIIPRSVLTTGVGSSAAGLTVTALMEKGEWKLEAGALVMSDGGVCCIDEFNSMKEHDRTAIHEAMEQQTISVAKAGIVCKLRTRCSILAACNPKGDLDPTQPLCMNIAMATPLLSRFDLILLIRDTINAEWDSQLADFILDDDVDDKNGSSIWPFEQLQSYFGVVKMLNPKLTDEAELILRRYYQLQRRLDNRNKSRTTVRMLESLIRLSQGHAKIMFHEYVEIVDAIFAIILTDASMDFDNCILNVNVNQLFFDNPTEYYENTLTLVSEKLDLNDILHGGRKLSGNTGNGENNDNGVRKSKYFVVNASSLILTQEDTNNISEETEFSDKHPTASTSYATRTTEHLEDTFFTQRSVFDRTALNSNFCNQQSETHTVNTNNVNNNLLTQLNVFGKRKSESLVTSKQSVVGSQTNHSKMAATSSNPSTSYMTHNTEPICIKTIQTHNNLTTQARPNYTSDNRLPTPLAKTLPKYDKITTHNPSDDSKSRPRQQKLLPENKSKYKRHKNKIFDAEDSTEDVTGNDKMIDANTISDIDLAIPALPKYSNQKSCKSLAELPELIHSSLNNSRDLEETTDSELSQKQLLSRSIDLALNQKMHDNKTLKQVRDDTGSTSSQMRSFDSKLPTIHDAKSTNLISASRILKKGESPMKKLDMLQMINNDIMDFEIDCNIVEKALNQNPTSQKSCIDSDYQNQYSKTLKQSKDNAKNCCSTSRCQIYNNNLENLKLPDEKQDSSITDRFKTSCASIHSEIVKIHDKRRSGTLIDNNDVSKVHKGSSDSKSVSMIAKNVQPPMKKLDVMNDDIMNLDIDWNIVEKALSQNSSLEKGSCMNIGSNHQVHDIKTLKEMNDNAKITCSLQWKHQGSSKVDKVNKSSDNTEKIHNNQRSDAKDSNIDSKISDRNLDSNSVPGIQKKVKSPMKRPDMVQRFNDDIMDFDIDWNIVEKGLGQNPTSQKDSSKNIDSDQSNGIKTVKEIKDDTKNPTSRCDVGNQKRLLQSKCNQENSKVDNKSNHKSSASTSVDRKLKRHKSDMSELDMLQMMPGENDDFLNLDIDWDIVDGLTQSSATQKSGCVSFDHQKK